ncbi:hypothetical protein BX600DRAFT_507390 [Xylariales sp. PMI_506]|nr:hypothetical protein BX600DRAFT_507390 [Xylariales sp. PMI_506]
MYFPTFAVLSLLATSHALTIPPNQPDGVYVVSNVGTANEVHERLADLDIKAEIPSVNTTNSTPSTLSKRLGGPTDIRCGCGIVLNHADCDAATANLEAQLGSGGHIEGGKCFYSIRNTVASFMCSYAETIEGTALQAQLAFEEITDSCGLYVAGTSGLIGYVATGYLKSNINWYTESWASPLTSC